MLSDTIVAKLDRLPSNPGVYLFRGPEGCVLYIGKARHLRSRVRSYFQPGSSDMRYFIGLLSTELHDLETIVVDSEKEAALLENQLIKEHRPRYNVKLRDDKEFLSLRLDPGTDWPRLEVVRRPRSDGARYFGPYHSASAARKTLRLVNRHFQLRTCTDSDFRSRVRPCLQYQIRRCPGPCVLDVSSHEYEDHVRGVSLFLDGRHEELVEVLSERMKEASDALAYESAARYRDQIRAIESVTEQQRVTAVRSIDQDVFGLFRQADQAELAVVMIRRGRVVEVRTFPLRGLALPDAEVLSGMITEYYDQGVYLPHEIICPYALEAGEGIAEAFGERAGRKVRLIYPRRGERAELLRLAMENAQHAFHEKLRAQHDILTRLQTIQKRLKLPRPPETIECIDISHHAGDDAVAVFSRLLRGSPDPSGYRSFHLRDTRAGDDYGAMHEALSRRLRRGRDRSTAWTLPDLLVLDGGRGQLGVALAVMQALGIDDLPVIALAKERARPNESKLVERIYVPGQKNPIPLEADASLRMLAWARDEAHRFSNDRRRRRQKKRTFRSPLDEIPGVGPKTREKLLRQLGSLKGVIRATVDELITAGASRTQAAAIAAAMGNSTSAVEPEPTHSTDHAEDEALHNAFESTFTPTT